MDSLTRRLLPLIGGQICIHACMTGTRLAAPLQALGAGQGALSVGMLLSLFSVAAIALSLKAGRYTDKHGYHAPVRVAVAMSFAGAFAATLSGHYVALCLAALLTGGGTSIALIAIQRYAGRLTSDSSELKRVFSWLALAPAISNFLGPFVAGLLIDHAGHRAAFACMAALPLFTLWWARRVPHQPREPSLSTLQGPGASRRGRNTWDLLQAGSLRRLLLVNWVLSAAWDLHTFIVPVLGHERGFSATAIGTILGAFALSATAVRLLIPVVAHRVHEWQVLVGAMLASALCFALYPLAPNTLAMGACAVGLGLALGSVQPMVMSMLHQITPDDRHGEVLGLRMMLLSVSSTLMPLLFGGAGTLVGAAPVFWTMALFVGSSSTVARKLEHDLVAAPGRAVHQT